MKPFVIESQRGSVWSTTGACVIAIDEGAAVGLAIAKGLVDSGPKNYRAMEISWQEYEATYSRRAK